MMFLKISTFWLVIAFMMMCSENIFAEGRMLTFVVPDKRDNGNHLDELEIDYYKLKVAGDSYIIKAVDVNGIEGHWSEPAEFIQKEDCIIKDIEDLTDAEALGDLSRLHAFSIARFLIVKNGFRCEIVD